MGIETENAELVGSREFYRTYATQMKRLEAGEIEKIVLTRRGQMIGVLLTPEQYEKLADGKS